MKSIRELVALVLTFATLFALPAGVVALIAGMSGRLADTDSGHNARLGVFLFLLSLTPPSGLAIWVWLWWGKWSQSWRADHEPHAADMGHDQA